MSVVFVVLPVALAIALAALIAFIWAVRSGQMDDLDTPGLRILHDEPESPPPPDQERNDEDHGR